MILLIQSRTDQSGWHELKCIYESSGFSYEKFWILNIASSEVTLNYLKEIILKSKAVIIGGLGETGYGERDLKKKRWFNRLRSKILPVLRKIIKEDKIPILGICFGHQLIAEALGARVKYAPDQAEVGVTQIKLTKDGEKDPFFTNSPKVFNVIEGHKDAVLTLPQNAIHLAFSKKCKIQAFRFGKMIYGVQFHPELECEDFFYRLSLYSTYKKFTICGKKPQINTKHLIKNFLMMAIKPK